MTQGMLAQAVGCDPETISQVERGFRASWSRRIAVRVFHALGERMPLTPQEAAEFLELTRLSPRLAQSPYVESTLARDVRAEDAGLPVPSDPTSKDMRNVHRALARLLAALGPTQTTDLLDSTADAIDSAKAPPRPATPQQPSATPIKEVTFIHPPKVPFKGAIERVHETIRAPAVPITKAKDSPHPKTKARKRSG